MNLILRLYSSGMYYCHQVSTQLQLTNITILYQYDTMQFHHHHHWLDSAWWALAFLRSFAHSSLSRATFFQFLTLVFTM